MKHLPSIKVDFLGGTSVEDCASEMVSFAGRIGAHIRCGFNGVELWADAGDDPKDIVAAFHQLIKEDDDGMTRIATAHDGRQLREAHKPRKRRPSPKRREEKEPSPTLSPHEREPVSEGEEKRP